MSKSFVELDENKNIEESGTLVETNQLPPITTVTLHADAKSMKYLAESLQQYLEDRNANMN